MALHPLSKKVPAGQKLSPARLVARLIVCESLLLVLAEAYLDRADVDDEKGKLLLHNMQVSTRLFAEQLGRKEVLDEVDAAANSLLEVLVRNLPAMKGEFGKPDSMAAEEDPAAALGFAEPQYPRNSRGQSRR